MPVLDVRPGVLVVQVSAGLQDFGRGPAGGRGSERHPEAYRGRDCTVRRCATPGSVSVQPGAGSEGRRDGRCEKCGKDQARRVWIGRQVRAILNHDDFTCQHGAEDPRDCPRCRKCITAFVRENEPELRSRVRSTWPAKTAAASAARVA